MTTTTITPWYERAVPFGFIEFWGTPVHIEKLEIIEKREGVTLLEAPLTTAGVRQAHFVFVMTKFGDMRLEVSKKVYDLIRVGDSLIVSYRRGRWSKALEGKIAR